MGLFAATYRLIFLPREVRRTAYPNISQLSLSDDQNKQMTLCGPTAVLDTVKHQDAASHFLKTSEDNRALGEELARDMGTRFLPSNNPGTEPDELIKGTEKFYADHGKKLTSIEWRGWGAKQTIRDGSNKVPSFNWIASQLKNKNKEVLLHVGRYKKLSDGSYERVSGHFVAAVGFKKKNLELILDDPSPSASRSEKSVKCKTLPKSVFKLDPKKASEDVKLKAYEQLEGFDLLPGTDCAVIDGVFSYEVGS